MAILPPPALPPSLSSIVAPAAPANPEQLKVNWDAVFPLLADCCTARDAFQTTTNELQMHDRMLRTSRFQNLSPEDQARIDEQKRALQTAAAEAESVFATKMDALKTMNWWAIGPTQGDTGKLEELIKFTTQLQNTTKSLFDSLDTPALAALPSTDDAQSSRPLKRRRLSEHDADIAAAAPAMEDEAVEKLRLRLETLETRVADVGNDIEVLQVTVSESITDTLQDQLQLRSASTDADSPLTVAVATVKMALLEQRVAELTEKLGTEAKKREALEQRALETEQENAGLVQSSKDMQRRLDTLEAEAARDAEEFDALSKAFELARSRPPAPAPTLPLELIVSMLDEPIRDAVTSTVKPLVEAMGKELEGNIRKHDAETYGKLWGKIALTLKVVDVVKRTF
ncbi:hypothetical protein HMN09_00078200 [Mycena chlorophos]|uniref:Uncharacterized protein n=1 Tax=Mycena chlorophos TaxID=658473 RepID=A0A8H6TPR9_MYCCL|nr:hypothetical protein HMN09_00078200 [Mycena chlorophos]